MITKKIANNRFFYYNKRRATCRTKEYKLWPIKSVIRSEMITSKKNVFNNRIEICFSA